MSSSVTGDGVRWGGAAEQATCSLPRSPQASGWPGSALLHGALICPAGINTGAQQPSMLCSLCLCCGPARQNLILLLYCSSLGTPTNRRSLHRAQPRSDSNKKLLVEQDDT